MRPLLLSLLLLAPAACTPSTIEDAEEGDGEAEIDFHGEGDHADTGLLGADFTGTVSQAVSASCSTSIVLGVSRQIADEMVCMAPEALVRFEEGDGITFTGAAVLPYLAPEAATALRAVAAGASLSINSGFRTVAQQYLLYRWKQQGRCGISAAATPGRSNHETGRAVDVANWSSRVSAMGARGWSHSVPGDPVHFDHLASPDLRGLDVHAFQRLWNRNHPEDQIDEDGVYGAITANRLGRAPARGFATGACGGGVVTAEVRVDNSDTGFSTSAGWWASTSTQGYAGANYLVIDPGVAGWADWRLAPAAGRYEVFAHFPPGANRTSNAVYRVRVSADAAPTLVTVDQRTAGTVSLGTFDLTATAWVSLDSTGGTGFTIADLISASPR